MFNVPVVVVYMLSLCFFSSTSLFYALFYFQFNLLVLCFFLFLFFVLYVLFLQTTLSYMLHCFSVMPGGFISAMELVGHSRVDSSMPLRMVPVGWV